MPQQTSDVEQILSQLADYFAQQPQVSLVYLYGSYARGQAWAGSDVDIGVLFDEHVDRDQQQQLVTRLRADIAQRLTGRQIDVRELNPGPLEFLFQVIKHRRCIYARNDRERTRFEAAIICRYLDFKPALDLYYGHMLHHLQKGDTLYGLRFRRRLADLEQAARSERGT
jgi:predicted nucleotidyltransferase